MTLVGAAHLGGRTRQLFLMLSVGGVRTGYGLLQVADAVGGSMSKAVIAAAVGAVVDFLPVLSGEDSSGGGVGLCRCSWSALLRYSLRCVAR